MRATRDSWKITPLPAARSRLALTRSFSPRELARLQDGFIPTSQDDKWFVFMERDTLYLHRSWTGICIYEVRLDGPNVVEAWVNRDPASYTADDDASELTILNALLDQFSGKRR